jgi:hypothetical protein
VPHEQERRRNEMRKVAMLAALVVVLVPLVAGVALAADQLIYCKSAPCYGTGNDDKIYERKGNGVFDKIIMRGGHDLVLANGYTNDTDRVKGGTGYDKINVADNDRHDTASGGKGGDWCIVDSRSEVGGVCSRVTVR